MINSKVKNPQAGSLADQLWSAQYRAKEDGIAKAKQKAASATEGTMTRKATPIGERKATPIGERKAKRLSPSRSDEDKRKASVGTSGSAGVGGAGGSAGVGVRQATPKTTPKATRSTKNSQRRF